MRKAKYTVKLTTQFKKDYKLAIKRGWKISLLDDVIAALAMGKTLPDKAKDHALSGNWAGHRECHILPDWLLVYHIENSVLVLTLTRTGARVEIPLKTMRTRKRVLIRRSGAFLLFPKRTVVKGNIF